jgi:hypothetical protein
LYTASEVEAEWRRVDLAAPDGENHRVRGVELTARNLREFSTAYPPILDCTLWLRRIKQCFVSACPRTIRASRPIGAWHQDEQQRIAREQAEERDRQQQRDATLEANAAAAAGGRGGTTSEQTNKRGSPWPPTNRFRIGGMIAVPPQSSAS